MNRWAIGLTLLIIGVSLFVIYSVSQWDLPKPVIGVGLQPKEWVLLQPTKCTEIPWRKEWAFLNQKSYDEFPLESELEILQEYYEGRGVRVLDIKLTYEAADPLCTACGCPEPFVFAIQTYERDAAKLAVSGFRVLDTTNPYIFTGPLFRQSLEQPLSYVRESDCDTLFSTKTFLDEWLGSKKDSCYIQAAIGAKNPQICEKVQALQARNTCITEVAVSLQYVELCYQLAEQANRDACISSVAGITQTISLCDQVQDSTVKYFCRLGAQN